MNKANYTIVTSPPLPPGPRPRSDERLARLAAALVTAAQDGDEAAVSRILEQVEPYRLVRLFMLIGSDANPDAVLMAAGFGTPENLKRCVGKYQALRRSGVPRDEIPADVVQGWRMYRRLYRRAQVASQAKVA